MSYEDLAEHEGPFVIDDETVQRVAAGQRATAEIEHLTRRLQEIPDFKRDPAGEHDSHTRGLVERRTALLQGEEALARSSRDYPALEREKLILSIHDRLATPWREHIMPPFADRTNDLPDPQYGTSGYIESFSTDPGEVVWAGGFRDIANTHPAVMKWWQRTWSATTILPAAPFKGWLHYRFDLRTEGHIYYAPVDTGAISESISVAGSSNASVVPTNWDITWVLNLILPFQPNLGSGASPSQFPRRSTDQSRSSKAHRLHSASSPAPPSASPTGEQTSPVSP